MRPTDSFTDILNSAFAPSTEADWEFLRMAAANLFKPKTPIDDDKLFAGRLPQINQVLETVYEAGSHAIIFGERGVGKTSLAKIIEKKVAPIFPTIHIPEPVSCGRTDDFYTLWGNAFNAFASANGLTPAQHFRDRANPYEVYNTLNDLEADRYHLFIFDEFDRIHDDNTLFLMADLLKHYSNNPRNITIIIVGVGDTLMDLFGRHESIARCCEQIKMWRMSEDELLEIIRERLPRINFSIDQAVERNIVRLSQGLPGYVHLLGQIALRSAIQRKSQKIEAADFRVALSQALEKSDYQTRHDYYKAVSSPAKDNKYKEVLLACAMAKTNELGYFFAGSLREPYSKIRGKPMDIPNYSTNLNNLCAEERGPALVKTGKPKRFQYRFNNPLLQPLTIMMGVNDGLIDLD